MRHYNMHNLFNICEFTILIGWQSAESSALKNKINKKKQISFMPSTLRYFFYVSYKLKQPGSYGLF